MVVFGPELEISQQDLKRPIQDLLKERLAPEILRDIGVVKIKVTEFQEKFFENHVQLALDSGSFGALVYNKEHISQTCTGKKGSWNESNALADQYPDSTIRELFYEFKALWDATDPVEKALLQSPEYAFENSEAWIQGSVVKYPESLYRQTSPSPFEGAVMEGDLNLPLDLHMVDPRTEEIFFNYIQAPGITMPWTYVYGAKSSTLFHMEDLLLGSSNFNAGPGTKYWACVPRNDIFKVLMFYANRKPEQCGHEYFNKRLGPTVKELVAAGIEVIFYEQKAGELMFLDCAVLHQVINIEWGISISKNVVTDTWTEWGMIGLWLRKQCMNGHGKGDSSDLWSDVTERFARLMKRLKCKNAKRCASMDRDMMWYLTSKWTPVNEVFREASHVIGEGCVVDWKLPPSKRLQRSMCLYSDINKSFY